MIVMPIPKSLATYKGNGKALAQIKNGKIVALYYEDTTLVHKEYILSVVGRERWCKAAEQELAKIKAEAQSYRATGNFIVISRKDVFIEGSVEDVGYTVDHKGNVDAWVYPPTAKSMQNNVMLFQQRGAIKNVGLANSLLDKLKTAEKLRVDGKCEAAADQCLAFINELQAQRGKGIDAATARIMIANAKYLLSHCP